MVKKLSSKIVPVLVTVCMVFGLFPGGGLSLNLSALTQAGTETNPTPITESPATIENPIQGDTLNTFYTFTATKGGAYEFKLETTCTDCIIEVYSVDNSYTFVASLISETTINNTFSQTVTFVAGTKYVLQYYNLHGDTQATLTCAAIGSIPTVEFSSTAVDVDEAVGTVNLAVTRSGDLTGTSSVQYQITGITATSGSDFTPGGGTVNFASGVDSRNIVLQIADDETSEANETIVIDLMNPANAKLGTNARATVTIHDYVSTITVSGAGSATTVENGQTLQMAADVQPSEAKEKSVTWSVTNGTGSATINTSGLLTGSMPGTVTVKATANDGSKVYDEQEITITSHGTLQFSAASMDVNETAGSIDVTVTRTGGNDGNVQLVVETPGTGTATKSVDYTSTSNTLTFGSGVTNRTFSVPIIDDSIADDGETFTITMHSPTGGAVIGTVNTVTVTIHDYVNSITISSAGNTTTMLNGATLQMSAAVSPSDADQQLDWSVVNGTGEATINASGLLTATKAGTVTVKAASKSDASKNNTFTITINPNYGTLQFNPATYTVNESGGSLTLTLTRINGSDESFTINYTTANGTAIAGSDYTAAAGTLTFGAGETSKTITVSLSNDTVYESAETFTVTLNTPSIAELDTSTTATVTIQDDDFVPVTSITVTVAEGVTTVEVGKSLAMAADIQPATATDKTVTWSVVPDTGTGTATIDASTGVLTATGAGTVTVRATSNDGSGVKGEKTITITVPPVTVTGVTVSPSSMSLLKGASKTFTAKVNGTGNPSQSVTWSVLGNNKAQTTISNAGKLTIASNETAKTLTVKAVSADDPTKSGTAAVTVTSPAASGGSSSDTATTVIVNTTSIASCDLSQLTLPSGVTSVSLVSRLVSSSSTNTAVKSLAQRYGAVGSGGVKLYYLKLLNQYDEEISGYIGSIRVRLLIPKGMSGDIRVYRYSEISGSLLDMQAVQNGDGMEFETSSLGYFAVVQHTGKTRPSIPETGAPN